MDDIKTKMKDKIINLNEYKNLVNNGRSLGTISPVTIISGPTSTLFYDFRGATSYTSGPSMAMGTLDRWRIDQKDSLPLNRDQWVFWSTVTTSLIRIQEVDKQDITKHQTKELPINEREYPNWTQKLVNDKLNISTKP